VFTVCGSVPRFRLAPDGIFDRFQVSGVGPAAGLKSGQFNRIRKLCHWLVSHEVSATELDPLCFFQFEYFRVSASVQQHLGGGESFYDLAEMGKRLIIRMAPVFS
jgi:hypothetical protein